MLAQSLGASSLIVSSLKFTTISEGSEDSGESVVEIDDDGVVEFVVACTKE